MFEHNGKYSPRNITLQVGSRVIQGFHDSEFIRTERNNEDDFTVFAGAQGDFAFVENLDRSGSIVFTLQQNARDNVYLSNLIESKSVFPVRLVHNGPFKELVVATTAMVGRRPRKSFSQEYAGREWVIIVGRLQETDK